MGREFPNGHSLEGDESEEVMVMQASPRAPNEQQRIIEPSDTLGTHMKAVGSFKLLSRDKEIIKAQDNDRNRKAYRHAVYRLGPVQQDAARILQSIATGDLVPGAFLSREGDAPIEADALERLALCLEEIQALIDQQRQDTGRLLRKRQELSSLDIMGKIQSARSRLAALLCRVPFSLLSLDYLVDRADMVREGLHDTHARLSTLGDSREAVSLQHEFRAKIGDALSTPEALEEGLDHVAVRRSMYDKSIEEMVNKNLRLSVHVAKRYRGRGIEYPDLIQEGNVGLLRAAHKFDWRRGYKFGTYATWWIRQGVSRALCEQTGTMYLPPQKYALSQKLERMDRECLAECGREMTDEEIHERLGMALSDIHTYRAARRMPLSFDTGVTFGDDEQGGLDELLSSPDSTGDNVDFSLLQERVHDVLKMLTAREREVIALRFGLLGNMPKTLNEIAEGWGLSRERIRQIEARALLKLRHPTRSRKLEPFAPGRLE